jgi:hypothetical protein
MLHTCVRITFREGDESLRQRTQRLTAASAEWSDDAAAMALSNVHYVQGGYDYDFVADLDSRFECPICLLCQRDPHQTSCGHR